MVCRGNRLSLRGKTAVHQQIGLAGDEIDRPRPQRLVLGLMHPVFGMCFGIFLAGAGLGLPVIAGRAARKHARRSAHGIE
ncbi:hypothetical protein AB9F46_35925, partial [Rhizobium leguminosarum]|uniref:hypothetical protein n=1 Tax=Rhizobium leguminosarum TaxID=384 RepID=UPI003F9DCB61